MTPNVDPHLYTQPKNIVNVSEYVGKTYSGETMRWLMSRRKSLVRSKRGRIGCRPSPAMTPFTIMLCTLYAVRGSVSSCLTRLAGVAGAAVAFRFLAFFADVLDLSKLFSRKLVITVDFNDVRLLARDRKSSVIIATQGHLICHTYPRWTLQTSTTGTT